MYGDDASGGAGDAVQMDVSEPTLENTLEASTFGIDEHVYEDDTSGATDAIQEDFSEPVPETSEEANAFSIEEPSSEGDYLQEPIDEPFYSYGASGARDYVQEDFLEPTPENIQETSTFGISEQSYGYDALGNAFLSRPPRRPALLVLTNRVMVTMRWAIMFREALLSRCQGVPRRQAP